MVDASAPMKAFIQVALKRTVLDPQGKTIQQALGKLGFGAIEDVRQGKVLELRFVPGTAPAEARRQAERAASELLANPVIEEYAIRWED